MAVVTETVEHLATAGTRKGYGHGTDRLVSPRETLDRVRPFHAAVGITRVANVTGLDHIGVPVVMACRPNSRSLAVSQGKGLTLDAAKASAVMEATELFHAEHITHPLALGAHDEIAGTRRAVDVSRISTIDASAFPRDRALLWIEGRELITGTSTWVPYDLVSTDFRLTDSYSSKVISRSSNGLASGNHLLEATSHAICELIERDSIQRWKASTRAQRDATILDLTTIDDPGCLEILDRLNAANFKVQVWDVTSAAGLPTFNGRIMEDPSLAVTPIQADGGSGCHVRREIALLRTLSEAIQSRLTRIAGSRDDKWRSTYLRDALRVEAQWAAICGSAANRPFHAAPTYEHQTFEEDINVEIAGVLAAGHSEVVVVDLTKPEFGIPVVRAIIPGLLDPAHLAPVENPSREH